MVRKLMLSASLVAAACPAAAIAAWQEASSPHFIVYADDKPERIRAFTERLEKFDKALRVMRSMPDRPTTDAERVRVYMVDDISVLRRLAGKGMSNVAGWYATRVGGPVAFVPRKETKDSPYDLDSQAILLHEYSHHFMFLNSPDVVYPGWLVEGFAELNATAIFRDNGDVVIGQMPGYRAWSVADTYLLPASRLIQLDSGKLNDAQTDALYSRGWLLTHYLTFEPSRAGQLQKYFRAINEGKSADEAAKVFGDLKQLDRDMTAYISRPSIRVLTIGAAGLSIGAITLRQMTPGEAAVMPARLRSTRGVDPTSAQDVVKLARKLAEPFPNDAGAQNELAEAEYDAGNFDASAAAADRAIAADPKSIHALLYRGMAEAARLALAKDRSDDHWHAVRQKYVAANKIDPNNPLALVLFYQSYLQAGKSPTTNAEDGLLTAFDLAPFDEELRMNAAAIMLRRSQTAEARRALAPVAYGPHGGAATDAARNALAAIDAKETGKAMAALAVGADTVPDKPD
jgi:tetratricopeptide (TPR) repeat protein